MVKHLQLEQRPDTPAVQCKPSGELMIRGRSLPENAERFYEPVLEWVKQYLAGEPADSTVFTIELEYFNSSSVKQLLSILLELENLLDMHKEVQVRWVYNQDDELMEMKGREMASMVDIPFEMDSYSL